MAAQQQTPQSARIPPDVPSDPGISQALGVYLRNFSLWARNGFAEQMRNNVALQGVQLRGYDTPAGENPNVWMLEASGSGTLALAPVALGTGKVGDPVPVCQTAPEGLEVANHIDIDATPSTEVALSYSQDGVMRWYTGVNTASNWFVAFCDDAGEYAGTAINADRASGAVTMDYGFTSNAHATFNNAITVQPGATSVFYNWGGGIWQAASSNVWVQSVAPGNSAYMTFHCTGEFACNFGLHSDARFHMGGWSFGEGTWYQFWSSADFANPASDYRIKRDIEPLPSMWEKVKSLEPISYRTKDVELVNHMEGASPLVVRGDDDPHWGFIAHELQEKLIETAAHGRKDQPDHLQAPTMLPIVAALTKALQEAMARIEALEARR